MIISPTTSDRTCFFFFGGGEGGSEISASLTSDATQKARPLSREHRMGIYEFNEKIESKMLRCDEKHTEKKNSNNTSHVPISTSGIRIK